jgi:hypothetical protein
MKWFFLAVALVAMGCDYSTMVSGCDSVTIDQSQEAQQAADGGTDAPVTPEPLPIEGTGDVGSRCDSNNDCDSGVCLPSNTSQFNASYCFDRTADGCMVVTEPSAFAAMCTKPGGKVYVCGDSWDVSSLGLCDDLGPGTLGEEYRCCTPKSFP